MTTFDVPIEIARAAEGPFERLDAAVDTGAFYSWVPRSFLERLGITPHGSRTFVLATGEDVDKPVGRAWMRINGEVEVTIVVFGDDGSEALLRAVTLEEFSLAVDPVNERLVRMPRLRMLYDLPSRHQRRFAKWT